MSSGDIICIGPKGFIDFGDYKSKEKQKVDNFEFNGDLYKLKTHNNITRLEKNGSLLFEAVPGVKINGLNVTEQLVEFSAYGFDDTQITLGLQPDEEYSITIDSDNVGSMKASLAGKVSFSTELSETPKSVRIEKMN